MLPSTCLSGFPQNWFCFQEGDWIIEEEGRAGVLCIVDEFDRDGEGVLLSPLGTYFASSVGESGHSDRVV